MKLYDGAENWRSNFDEITYTMINGKNNTFCTRTLLPSVVSRTRTHVVVVVIVIFIAVLFFCTKVIASVLVTV